MIPPEIGLAYGLSGANIRASGVDWDLRRDQRAPLAYDKVDFKVWTHPDGDSFARYWVRLQETRESCRMVLQMLDQLPSGPVVSSLARSNSRPIRSAWLRPVPGGMMRVAPVS